MRILCFLFLSIQLIGQEISWTNNTPLVNTYSSPRTTDLNNDGIKDIVIGGGINGEPTPFGVIAIDGASGNTIWTMETRNEMFNSPQFLDYNGDNVDDILIGGRDAELRLINGISGELIWEFWSSETNPNDDGWYNFYTPQIISDQTGDGINDILAANGGDHSLNDSELDRPPGHIMIIDGNLGSVFKTAVVPDSNETYLSPVICDLNGNGEKSILFGTGGETIEGNLWLTNLNDLLDENLSNAIPLVNNSELGHIAAPSIGDLNGDGILDIITQGFDGKVTAINGDNLDVMWQFEMDLVNTESTASPVLGKFSSNDNNLDVFVTLFEGFTPQYSAFHQILLNGENGDILWQETLGYKNYATPIAFDSNNDGKDEVLISIIKECCALTPCTEQDCENELILIDFINNSQTSLLDSLDGGNINSTPQITDIDNNGFLNIIFATQANAEDPFIVDATELNDGIDVINIETNFSTSICDVAWGSYMGTYFNGQYNNCAGCIEGDLDLFAFPSYACPGENNAVINLFPSAGTPPYTYLWSNGEVTEDLENLGPGLYSVTVTDSNGICDTISREVNAYEAISFYEAPSCPGNSDGLVHFNSTGCDCNTSSCQWIWQLNGDTIAQGDGSSATETYKYLFNIQSGVYTATIIHPDGCEIQEEIIVPDPIMVDSIYIQNECESNDDGWINLTVNPADSLIQNYLWSTGDTTQDIYDLSAGSYSVIVSDTLCVDTLYFEVDNIEYDTEIMVSNEDTTLIPSAELVNLDLTSYSDGSCLALWAGSISHSGEVFNESTSGAEIPECDFLNPNPQYDFCSYNQLAGMLNIYMYYFYTEGVYELNIAEDSETNCIDQGDSIVFMVTDSCDTTTIPENNIQSYVYTDLNNNLIIYLEDNINKYQLSVFDMNGKKIIDTYLTNTHSLSLENHPQGVYSVRLLSSDFVYNTKILVY